MNPDVPTDIQEFFKCLEFIGKPFKYKGRDVCKAWHLRLERNVYFSLTENFGWLIDFGGDMPDELLKKIN